MINRLRDRLKRLRRRFWCFVGWFGYYRSHLDYGWRESARRAWRWAKDAK